MTDLEVYNEFKEVAAIQGSGRVGVDWVTSRLQAKLNKWPRPDGPRPFLFEVESAVARLVDLGLLTLVPGCRYTYTLTENVLVEMVFADD